MRTLVAAVFVAIALPSASWGTTYNYVGLPYSTEIAFLENYTPPCTTGNCANYTGDMQVTGYINLAAPIPANQTNRDITSLITSFSFSDGVHTFANTDPFVLAPRPFIRQYRCGGQHHVAVGRSRALAVERRPAYSREPPGLRRARWLQRRAQSSLRSRRKPTTIARPT